MTVASQTRHPLRRTRTALAIATIATIGLTACSPGGGSGEGGDEPVAGGTITVGTYLDPTCIDPQQIGTNASLSITRQLTDSLTDQDPDTGEIVPWLAKSWEINDDSSVFTFSLREDVTFSDGSPFDAEVVKTNLDRIVELGAGLQAASTFVAGLESVTVVDEYTVEIAFAAPNAQFLQATSGIPLGMLSSDTAQMSPEERCSEGIVGTGPFVLESYTANDSTILAKREDYAWGSPTWSSQGPAHLDGITFRVIPENGVRTGALLSGQIDAMDNVQQQDEASVSGDGFHIVTRPNPGFAVSIFFNLESEVSSDPAVRHAIMTAINRDEILTVLGPTGAAISGILSDTTPGASDASGYLEFDPDGAADTLDEAGWAVGDDGVRVKDGVRLSMDMPYFFDGPVAELLQQQLGAIGIELNIREVVVADFIGILADGTFDVTIGNLTRADIDVLRSVLTSAGANNYNLADPELEELLQAQASEPDPQLRADLAAQIQTIVLENAYAVPMHALAGAYGVSDTVHDFKFDASTRLTLHDAWVDR